MAGFHITACSTRKAHRRVPPHMSNRANGDKETTSPNPPALTAANRRPAQYTRTTAKLTGTTATLPLRMCSCRRQGVLGCTWVKCSRAAPGRWPVTVGGPPSYRMTPDDGHQAEIESAADKITASRLATSQDACRLQDTPVYSRLADAMLLSARTAGDRSDGQAARQLHTSESLGRRRFVQYVWKRQPSIPRVAELGVATHDKCEPLVATCIRLLLQADLSSVCISFFPK